VGVFLLCLLAHCWLVAYYYGLVGYVLGCERGGSRDEVEGVYGVGIGAVLGDDFV